MRPGHWRARAAVPLTLILLAACAGAAPRPAAVPALEARVQGAPADVDAALRLGLEYRAAGRLDDARVLLERTSANVPREHRLVLLLGLTYEDLGRFEDARPLYERYLESGSPALRREVRARLAALGHAEMRGAAREALAREAELSGGTPAAGTVAVFPFLVQTSDSTLRPLGRALAEMLSTDLAQTPRLTVLERARVQLLLDEARLGGTGLVEPATAVRAGRLLSAATVVQGRLSGGDLLRMEALLAAAAARGEGPSVQREGPLNRLLDEEKELALRIYSTLGIELTPAERERVTRRMTENVQALLVFGAGLEASDAGDFRRAAALFRQAARLDPAFAAARQRAEEAAGAALADQVTTTDVAAHLLGDLAVVLDPSDFAPIPLSRDPTSEALGSEGFSRPRTTIQIIITRP